MNPLAIRIYPQRLYTHIAKPMIQSSIFTAKIAETVKVPAKAKVKIVFDYGQRVEHINNRLLKCSFSFVIV